MNYKKNTSIDFNEKSYLSAFHQFKSSLANDPLLVYPDPENVFTLNPDAPNNAIGSVSCQGNNPYCISFQYFKFSGTKLLIYGKRIIINYPKCKHLKPYLAYLISKQVMLQSHDYII